jgi:hypothetical protein
MLLGKFQPYPASSYPFFVFQIDAAVKERFNMLLLGGTPCGLNEDHEAPVGKREKINNSIQGIED